MRASKRSWAHVLRHRVRTRRRLLRRGERRLRCRLQRALQVQRVELLLARQLGPGGIHSPGARRTGRLRPRIPLLLLCCRPGLSLRQLLSLLQLQLLESLLAQVLLELRLRVAALGLGPGWHAWVRQPGLLRQPLLEQQLLLLSLQLLLLLEPSVQILRLHLLLQPRVLPQRLQWHRCLELWRHGAIESLRILPRRALEGQAWSEAPAGLPLAAGPV